MVLNAISSSDEEDGNEDVKQAQGEKHKATRDAPKPAPQPAQKAASAKESQSATAVDNDSAVAAPTEVSPITETSPTPSSLDVDNMRVPELRKALASKGLATTGRKAELIARLQGADVA
jgi:hypothetical protein